MSLGNRFFKPSTDLIGDTRRKDETEMSHVFQNKLSFSEKC